MLNWDEWRERYPDATFAEQRAFHSEIYAAYPKQHHFSTEYAAQAIAEISPTTVVELGGWDGELAKLMLADNTGIDSWTNVEICQEAAVAGERGADARYSAWLVHDWYWSRTWTCDLFVASHVIEHLSAQDLERVIAATKAKALFFDAPLDDYGHGWHGFTGTHILPLGWMGVNALCLQYGYDLVWANDHDTDPSSGERARACLYRQMHE